MGDGVLKSSPLIKLRLLKFQLFYVFLDFQPFMEREFINPMIDSLTHLMNLY